MFSRLRNLEHVNLSHCNISVFKKDYIRLNNLKYLDLSYNQMTNLKAREFVGLNKSCVIWLRGNHIYSMSTELFKVPSHRFDLPKVNQTKPFEPKKSIKICFNDSKLISVENYTENEILPSNCSENNERYADGILNLSNMNITEFHKGWYKLGNLSINHLNLNSNNISRLTSDILNDLPASIVSVDFSSNPIKRLETGVIVNKHLRKMNFKYNFLAKIEDHVFINTNLTTLTLSLNHLKDMKFAATLPPTLTEFFLETNAISKISREFFQGLKTLEVLRLGSNLITELDLEVFADLKNIKQIFLERNRMRNIWRNSSTNLSDSLEVLDLQNNLLENLTAGTFVDSPTDELLLNNNRISNIENGTFSLTRLRKLDLSSNYLSVIHSGMLQGLTNLRNLRIESNSITKIKKDTFKNFKNLCKLSKLVDPIKGMETGNLQRLVPTEGCDVVVTDVPIEMIHEGVYVTNVESSSDRKQIFSFIAMITLIHLI